MLRILSLILTILFLAGGTVLVMGYTSIPKYTNSMTFEVSYSPEITWQELLNIRTIPQRKADVASVEVLEEFGKLLAWQENLKNGGYRIYRMNSLQEKKQLVLELTSSSYGLTGIWTFDIVPVTNNNTQITITEESSLNDIKIRGYRTVMGREHDLLVWQKYIRVGLVQALLIAP